MKNNIVLIGMPGVGKSSIGVVLAKAMGYDFLDSDLVIQQKEGRMLSDIVKTEGHLGFVAVEERINAEIEASRTVIATGGSVIYGPKAMAHLKEIGTIVYLKASFDTVMERVTNIEGRGVTMPDGMTFEELYYERIALYEAYAEVTVAVDGKTIEETIHMLRGQLMASES